MSSIAGNYDGEGPNVAAPLKATNPPDVAASGQNNSPTGQGKTGLVPVDRRRRLRTSTEGARDAVAISVGGGDQVLSNYARGVYVSSGGTLVCRLVDSAADTTFAGLSAGVYYPFCVAVVRQTGTTCAGILLL